MRKIGMFTASMACLMSAVPALAQSEQGLETVIVTARKVAEDAQTVPISISSYNQAELDQLNVRTIEDLKYTAPSVYVAPTAFRQDALNVTIRGQRNFDAPSGGGNPGLGFDTATAIYKDGVYYARAVGLGGSLFDMDNVEVLKGPQGTLVGRNTTGGAILYTSREPGPEFDAYIRGTAGDYGRAGIQGAINIPLSDTFFARLAVNMDNQEGYVANYFYDPVSGARNNQPSFGTNKVAGLLSLKWQPDESFNLVFRADIAAEHDTGSTYHDLSYFVGTKPAVANRPSICNIPGTCVGIVDLLGHTIASYYTTVTPGGVSGVNTSPAAYNAVLNSVAREQTYGFWSTEQAKNGLSKGHYQTYSLTANKAIDDINIKAMAAYRTWDNSGISVSRGQPFETNTYNYNFPQYESWQSEVTVTGKALDDKLQWTAGLFYFNERSPNDGGTLALFSTNGGSVPPAAPSGPAAASGKQITFTDWSHNSEENSSYAAYAQGTYTLWDDTRLTAGVRYTYDERMADINSRTIQSPATVATNNALIASGKPAVYSSTPFVFEGISYAGQSDLCFLTDANGNLLPLSQCSTTVRKSYHKPTWTLAVDHDLWDGTMVYATMRSGYRAGAINTQSINIAANTALPENVLDYEVGVKSQMSVFGMPFRANVALYQTAYHNIQVQQEVPNVTLATVAGGGACTQAALDAGICLGNFSDNITLNAAKARIYGVEWDFTVLPTDWLTLNASGSYIDPRYTDYTFIVPPGYLQPAGTTNLSGTPIPVPAWQTNETATVNFGTDLWGLPLGDAMFTAHYYWQSRYLADMRNFNPSQRTSPYGLLNIRASFTNFLHQNAELAFFMNNVANTEACLPEYNGVLNSVPNPTFGVPNTSGVLQCIPLPPRMMGVQVTYNF
jgi:iron complex outermembrane receptor protein